MSNVKASPAEQAPALILSIEELDAMRNASGSAVTGHVTMTALLASYGLERLVSRDSELTTTLKNASYEGAMMAGCGVDLADAQFLLALSASTHKTARAGDKRTLEQDKVYSLAKYNWSVSCDAVGLPKGGNGNARGSNAGKQGEAVKDAPITVEAFHVPHGLNSKQVVELFAKFHDAMRRVLAENAKTVIGDAGSALRQCVDDVASYIEDADKALEADKPVLSEADALRAEIAALKAQIKPVKAKLAAVAA